MATTSTWDRLPPERREAVLAAAQREFGLHGFAGASMNTIARDAGVAKGSLFQYFDDKLGLYLHLGEVATLRVRAAMEAQLADLPWEEDFYGALRTILGRWEAYFHTHPSELSMMAAVNLEPDAGPRGQIRTTVYPHYLAIIEPLVDLGQAVGALRPDIDREVLVSLLLLLLPHIALAPHRDGLDPVLGLGSPDEADRDRALDRLVATLRAAFG
ncbi:MAG: TetR/AcrR family transcriptional regulator [Nocardioides sp.]|uniref:TetR/AcrR family transcriptional regulator n=1 Tax=Nocardioides sp. TaxID=35761 RepID=UPI003F0CCD28